MDVETVVVYRGTGGNARSDFFKTFLEGNGVPCLVRSNTSVAAHPFTVGPMGEFEIVVAREDAERAQDLLESVTSEEEALPDDPGAEEPVSDENDEVPRVNAVFLMLGVLFVIGGIGLITTQPSGAGIGIALIIGSLVFFFGSRRTG